jgi:hypothetical protein
MRKRSTVLRAVVLAAVLGACATGAPVDEATRRRSLEAAAVCGKNFPDLQYRWDDFSGKLKVTSTKRDAFADYFGFRECLRSEVERREPSRSGRLAATAPTQSIVRVDVERGLILAPIVVNGTVHGRLIVDTGASLTILGEDIVKAIGLTVPADAPRGNFRLADGRVVHQPIVRIASLRVGEMTVEDLDVAIGSRTAPGDGLLGQNFLRHFRVAIEPERGRLVLDTGRPAPPPRVTGTPNRLWAVPAAAWAVGDVWRYRWRAPSGNGTYEARVIGDETIDGVRHLVVDSGGRKQRLRADTAGVVSEHSVDGQLIARFARPVGHPWPLRVGATWDLDAEYEDGAGRTGRGFLRCAATHEATLAVPAGTFDTLVVVCQNHAGVVVRETWWANEPHAWVRERRLGRDGDHVEELLFYSVR